MTTINLDDATARELTAAAEGMTVNQFVRSRLLPAVAGGGNMTADQLLGLMSAEADVMDEVVADALASREKHPLRTGSDG